MDIRTKCDVVYDYNRRADEKRGRTGMVYIRVYEERTRRRYVSTGVKVLPSQWSERRWVVKHKEAARLNAEIREALDRCEAIVRVDVNVPTGAMRVDRSEASFLDWCAACVDKMTVAQNTREHYRGTLRTLHEAGCLRRFTDVCKRTVEQYLDHVRRRTKRRMGAGGVVVEEAISEQGVYNHYKRLRHLVRVAQGEGLLPMDALRGVAVPRGRSKARCFLNDEEVEAWRGVRLPNTHLMQARDLFVVQMGTGLAYADLMGMDFSGHVRYDGFETLQGTRTKTGEQFFVVVLPMAVEVLERWGWTVPRLSNQKYNDYLGVVAEAAGIDKHVTSHVARHTYATRALSHGVRIEAVQRTLGHSSITTTQIYAKLVDRAVIEAFKAF